MRKTYVVTKNAGTHVGALMNPGAGSEIQLSDSQAEHPLRLGHIALKQDLPKPEKKASGKR